MSPTAQPAGPLGSPAEMSVLFQAMREDAKEERAEHKAEVQEMRAEMEKMRAEFAPAPQRLISDEQLAALQARLARLHSAQLLADGEFFSLEDLCADYLALGVVTAEMAAAFPAANGIRLSKLLQLARVSEGIAADGSFARQVRRKFL